MQFALHWTGEIAIQWWAAGKFYSAQHWGWAVFTVLADLVATLIVARWMQRR